MPKKLTTQEPSWSYESHRRRQVRRGLELTAEERLRWLETTLEETRSLLGRAAKPSAVTPEDSHG